jgi:hypothetical protein
LDAHLGLNPYLVRQTRKKQGFADSFPVLVEMSTRLEMVETQPQFRLGCTTIHTGGSQR